MLLTGEELAKRIDQEKAKIDQNTTAKLSGLNAGVITPETVGAEEYEGILAIVVSAHVVGEEENDRLVITLAFPVGEGHFVLVEEKHMGVLVGLGNDPVTENANLWLVYQEHIDEVNILMAALDGASTIH